MTTPAYKARLRLRQALNNKNISERAIIRRVGCSRGFLKQWLDYTKVYFCGGSGGNEQLELDHFIPVSSFSFKKRKHMKQVNHWTNLRYLPKRENRIKSSKLPTALETKDQLRAIRHFSKHVSLNKLFIFLSKYTCNYNYKSKISPIKKK